ncbi:MAG: hypothetical protein LBL07_18315 [Tannerella sp.]|jgi:hypothetical protein|nr:hypothetical protein [Tannerella sp.]
MNALRTGRKTGPGEIYYILSNSRLTESRNRIIARQKTVLRAIYSCGTGSGGRPEFEIQNL